MQYSIKTKPTFDKDYKTRCKKNEGFRRIVDKKIREILRNPHHYKPLQWPMDGLRRVHVGGVFVLIYEIEEESKSVVLVSLKHHDEVYGR